MHNLLCAILNTTGEKAGNCSNTREGGIIMNDVMKGMLQQNGDEIGAFEMFKLLFYKGDQNR